MPISLLTANTANGSSDVSAFPEASAAGWMPLLRAQRPFWVGQQLDPDSRAFNAGQYVELKGELDPDLFEKAVDICLAETELLRLRIFEEERGVRQFVGTYTPGALARLDFSSDADPEASAARWMQSELHRRYDIASGRGYAWSLIRMAPDRHFLLLIFHHLVIDGVSLSLIVQRVRAIYESLIAGVEPASPAVPAFSSLIEFEAEYCASSQFQSDRQYWKERLGRLPAAHQPLQIQNGHSGLDEPSPNSVSAPANGCRAEGDGYPAEDKRKPGDRGIDRHYHAPVDGVE